MLSDKELLEQLWIIHRDLEWWYETKEPKEKIVSYFKERLASGNVITVEHGDTLAGYLEFYLSNGVCYIHNLFIRAEFRRGRTAKLIKHRLFEACKGAKVFFGERNKFGTRFPEFKIRR